MGSLTTGELEFGGMISISLTLPDTGAPLWLEALPYGGKIGSFERSWNSDLGESEVGFPTSVGRIPTLAFSTSHEHSERTPQHILPSNPPAEYAPRHTPHSEHSPAHSPAHFPGTLQVHSPRHTFASTLLPGRALCLQADFPAPSALPGTLTLRRHTPPAMRV